MPERAFVSVSWCEVEKVIVLGEAFSQRLGVAVNAGEMVLKEKPPGIPFGGGHRHGRQSQQVFTSCH